MQFYLAVLSLALVTVNAESVHESYYSGSLPSGETHDVSEDNPNVKEAKEIVIQELKHQAINIPGSPSVDVAEFVAKEQVSGTRYNLSFKAVRTYSTGEKIIKSCTASLIKHQDSPDAPMTFSEDTNPNEKIKCV